MYLAVHPGRIVLRVVVYDVFCEIRLKGQQTGRKGVVKSEQLGRVWADHNDTILFGGAEKAVVGGLIGWGKNMGRDRHRRKVAPVLAEIRRVRGSVASVGQADGTIKNAG